MVKIAKPAWHTPVKLEFENLASPPPPGYYDFDVYAAFDDD